jgi:DNA repair protein RadC
MIKQYNIINDYENHPKLNIQREIDINGENISIEESVEILNQYFNMYCLAFEHIYMIGFDNKMNIVGIFLISTGTSKLCHFYQKNIATYLLLSGAERFILYHNHPNGTLEISEDDKSSIIYFKNLSSILDIEFIDSIIISKNGWKCIERGVSYEYDEEDAI